MKKPVMNWVGFDYIFIQKVNLQFNNKLQCSKHTSTWIHSNSVNHPTQQQALIDYINQHCTYNLLIW